MRDAPVLEFFAVTEASAIAAPEGSVTKPDN